MLLEHLWLNVNPTRLCRNPWAEGAVTLPVSVPVRAECCSQLVAGAVPRTQGFTEIWLLAFASQETPICKSHLKLFLLLIHALTLSLQPVPISTKFTAMGKGQRCNHNCDSFAPCQTGLDRHCRALIFILLGKTSSKNLSTFVYFSSWHREEEKTNQRGLKSWSWID